MAYKRGDVYWVEIPERSPTGHEISKRRPCVVMSLSEVNDVRLTVVVVPLTSASKQRVPIVVSAPSLGADSKAVCDQIFAVDKHRIKDKITTISEIDLRRISNSLRAVLGL